MHPLVHGDYPDVMKSRMSQLSSAEGRNNSRLPEFNEVQKQEVKGLFIAFGFLHL